MSADNAGFHVVLSYGDVFRQSGYRTKVLGELVQYERYGHLQPFLIAFDRDAARLGELNLGGVEFRAYARSAVTAYFRNLSWLSRRGPIRIVHAHNLYSGALALSARALYGYKVLVELHGRIPEEYLILRKGGNLSYWALKQLESWVMRSADHIIPISHKLKDYLVTEFQLNPSKLTVIPDCADPSAFRWDSVLRENTRNKLQLGEKFVCVHLGSFFTWYDPDLIVKAFKRISSEILSSHLLVVTEDVERTRAYLSGKILDNKFTVMSAPHEEVPSLLAACDLGFLLLRSTPNIKVSSPSKFSEYLNSGVPVLITPQVGDFSELVWDERVGTIATDDGDFEMAFVRNLVRNRAEVAQRCTAAGRQLTWEAFRSTWSQITDTLQGSEPSLSLGLN